jgi:hypothetical protein
MTIKGFQSAEERIEWLGNDVARIINRDEPPVFKYIRHCLRAVLLARAVTVLVHGLITTG